MARKIPESPLIQYLRKTPEAADRVLTMVDSVLDILSDSEDFKMKDYLELQQLQADIHSLYPEAESSYVPRTVPEN